MKTVFYGNVKTMFFTINFLLVTLFTNAQAPVFKWAKQMGGQNTSIGQAIAVDKSGNVYTTGGFDGIVDFNPGTAVLNLNAGADEDQFISRLSASGNLAWAKNIGGSGNVHGTCIALDALDNVYTAGYFNGTADFDPGTNTYNLTSAGMNDIFISKSDASGNFIWAKQMGGISEDEAYSIAVDASGNVYTTGRFQATSDFDPGANDVNLVSAGIDDIFISKLDASGNYAWVARMGGSSDDRASSIVLDKAGSVYCTGRFDGTADFDPGTGTFNMSSASSFDIFILKLDAGSNFAWAKQIGGTSDDFGNSITVDVSGNIYTTGSFQGMVDFDPGANAFNITASGTGMFISKLNSSGSFVWAKNMEGSGIEGYAVAADAKGNVFTTGYFEGAADLNPGTGTLNYTSLGGFDIYISKLDSSGDFVWATQIGGVSDDIAFSIALDPAGYIYTTGYFGGTINMDPVDFDPGTGTFNMVSVKGLDAFVHKMSTGTVGVKENTIMDKVSIYPNPGNGMLNILIPGSLNNTDIEVYNIMGTLIYEQTGINQFHIIDLSSQVNGLYIVKVIGDGQLIETRKITKQ